MDLKLITDIRSMIFHSAKTDMQIIAYFFTRFVSRDESQYFSFGKCEALQLWFLLQQRTGIITPAVKVI